MALDYGSQSRPHFIPPALRAPFEGRAWREFGYLLLSMPISTVLFGYAIATIVLGAGLLVTFLGVPVLAVGLAGCRGFGMLERARARALLGLDVPDPAPARGAKSGLMSWVGAVLKSGVSWRHLLYAILHFPWALFAFVVSLTFWTVGWGLFSYPLWHGVFAGHLDQSGIAIYSDSTGEGYFLDSPVEIAATSVVGLVLVLFSPWLIRALTTVDRLLVTGLLGPSRLATRVSELESDRGVVVDTAAADLRRIERDLHDGAQARLVALAMDLGLAKEKLAEDPEAAARMVGEAHGEVKTALQELRDLARGIHPAVLTDRGLDAALSAIASRCTVPVEVEVDLPYRPAAAIEGIAYFTVSELLQNISKHARATRATVEVWQTRDRLMLQVTDDGRGGADRTAGSGLAGLTDRLDAVDGVLVIDSPAGGPTTVTAELPWRG
ncbi:putative two-component system sensor kinase [Streptomyces sp. L-9-10]|uniref:sensor histidine kinase n=1 Tax=unclassified Streptomyces TaxID=2593676 RepID=UPI00101DEEE4|nr:sensor histidine kinase [Streptomyces sp. L-9-10]RYJ22391.1 putative two-component system sensor kinase [Streptomyces sp. L-9-10]